MSARRGPERVETARLVLRRPQASEANPIFARYASDAEVTRLVGWPRHRTVDDTRGFLSYSDASGTDRTPART